MTNIQFIRSGKALHPGDIAEFEAWLGVDLPNSYKQFLLRTNGGSPSRHHLKGAHGCYVESFFVLAQRPEHLSLRIQVRDMTSALPKNVIPIGITGSGDRLCLNLSDGQIRLWEHEREYRPRESIEELAFLATNIDDLINRLEGDDTPASEDLIEKLGRWGDVSVLDEFLNSGHDINELSGAGEGIVKLAAYYGHLDFIKECIRRGGATTGALHAAIFAKKMDVVELLLEHGVDVNEVDEQGRLPLDLIPMQAYLRNPPIVQLLKRRGARRKAED